MIEFRAASFMGAAAGTDAVGTEPSGTVQNDVMVALVECDGNGRSITAPSGWTQLFTGTGGTSFSYWLGYIVRGASAPALTWTWSPTGSTWRELVIATFSGVDTASPIDASAQASVTTTASPNPPAVTAGDAAALAIAVCNLWAGSGAGGWTPPSGYTIRNNNAAGHETGMATKQLSATGSEDPGTFTNGASSDTAWAATVTLTPAAVQQLRPDADTDVASWATTPLWSKLNDQSDATVVSDTLA